MSLIWGRFAVWFYSIILFLAGLVLSLTLLADMQIIWALTAIFAALSLLGLYDFTQKRRAVRANYPLLGRMRYILESIRPELRQYFWEADTDELPFFTKPAHHGISACERYSGCASAWNGA